MAGQPFVSNVVAGIELANSLDPGLVFLEGSGAAMPPVASDACVLVAGAQQPVEHLAGYLGRYRVLVSDALVLTMAEEPLATREKVQGRQGCGAEVKPGMEVVPVVFRPRPMEHVEGRRVAFFSTAPAAQKGMLRRYLEEQWGCRVVVFSANLADRVALRTDFGGRGDGRRGDGADGDQGGGHRRGGGRGGGAGPSGRGGGQRAGRGGSGLFGTAGRVGKGVGSDGE